MLKIELTTAKSKRSAASAALARERRTRDGRRHALEPPAADGRLA
jgi:hypothetical protein